MGETNFENAQLNLVIIDEDGVATSAFLRQADEPPGGGSFLSTDIVRVDPTGNDSTGVVGDLTKPFLTVQGAINALEALDPAPNFPFIDVGNNNFREDLVTSLEKLGFVGNSPHGYGGNSNAFDSITASVTIDLVFNGVRVGSIDAPDITIGLINGAIINDDVTASNEAGGITIISLGGGYVSSTLSGSNYVSLAGLDNESNGINIECPGNVFLVKTFVNGDITCNNLTTHDTPLGGSFNASGVVTVTDYFMNPGNMDFSTLPTTDPGVVGRAWVDTTANFVIKVSQGP